MTILGRDVIDVDALVTDRYLESLLASREPGPASDRLEGAVRLASERLTRDLPRFHPSFRFEERLAVRLAEAAAAMRRPAAAGAEGAHAAIPFPALPVAIDPFALDDDDDDVRPAGRPLLLGGAVAASALSLAGAAWVAWRRSRPGGSPMARAARAAHAMRERPVQGGV